MSGKRRSQCSEGPRCPVRRAGLGKPSLASEHRHAERSVEQSPLSTFFPAFDSKHTISIKICFPAKTEHRLWTAKSLWSVFLLTPHQQLGWHAFEQTKSDFALLVFRAFWLNAEWEIHTFFKQCGFFFPVPLIHLVLWRSWNPGKC